MVSYTPQKRKTSEYSLEHIHRPAGNQQVYFKTSAVSNDTTNLGYLLTDVCECLKNLTSENYRESVRYGESEIWLDVYHCQWSASQSALNNPPNNPDSLYIKLGFNKKCTAIVVSSFHLS
ncbi:type II toxin-antitoxin system MqsR family toxin [Candidatus Spongiihabitans sp.]|uniref:type II toxin-antitoxin system MqsR family toxin n=1 Tax=Candidatus Spongiihabitans sp. TaxID=3101308 RepID=UPI003C6FE9FC